MEFKAQKLVCVLIHVLAFIILKKIEQSLLIEHGRLKMLEF